MRLALAVVGIGLALVGRDRAKMPASHPAARAVAPQPPAWSHAPTPPLPMLPSVARVRVEAARDRVVVIEDVNLPRGDWQSGGLDLYVAFGAPGTPIALDARLTSPAEARGDARSDEPGERVATETVPARGPGTQPLLGPPQMAGVVLRIKEAQLKRAYAAGEIAVIRIRSLLRGPAADATGARDVVVRLGVAGGLAMTLGRIQVVSVDSKPWIVARAEANLCGPEADPWGLSVTLSPKPSGRNDDSRATTIAPQAALRHASDDLCIRWWTTDATGR